MGIKAQDIIVNGIILSTMDLGEADKRLVLLTKQLGKITVFAYGAKRQKSPFIAAANPFVCGEFSIVSTRGAYRLKSVRCDNYFRELMEEYNKSCYAFYFLEFVSYFAMENMDCTDYLNLLYQSFKALINEEIPDKLVRYIFELKMFTINGEAPEVYKCFNCQEDVENGYFSLIRKCVVHQSCADMKNIPLGPSTIYTLQYIISASLSRLYCFKVSNEVYLEFKKMMDEYRRIMVNYTFKSEVFLTE